MQLNLLVKNMNSIKESFQEYIKPEVLDGDNQYATEGFYTYINFF